MTSGTRLRFCPLACALVLAACGGSGKATAPNPPTYVAFSNVTPVTLSGYTGDAMEPFISRDGRYLFFNNRNDPATDTELYYASRIDDRSFTFLGPVPGANSPQLDGVPSLDGNGNFYFVSTRSYTTTLSTLYAARFAVTGVTGVALVDGVSRLRGGAVNFDAEISPDGTTLWFADGDYGAQGDLRAAKLAYATRAGTAFARDAGSDAVLATVNAGGLNYAPAISADGRELFFTRWASTTDGSTPVIYRAARATASAPFGTPEVVSAASGFVEAPSLSGDGRTLYFHRLVNGAYTIYCAQRP